MADIENLRFYQRCGFRAIGIERDAFTPTAGYAPDLLADGIPVRDAIRFARSLDGEFDPASTHVSRVRHGLIVTLESRAGKEDELAAFLRAALPLVEDESGTLAWFALRAGVSSYAIVDVFPSEQARQAHLDGPVAAALVERSDELLAGAPEIRRVDVLAAKLPLG